MLHEFEEIIFMNVWMRHNKEFLVLNYPRISKYIVNNIGDISTSAFSVAVFEEFILISMITLYTYLSSDYNLWTGLFMAFFIHLIIHLIQFLILRKYIPAIITTIICIPYCILTLLHIYSIEAFTTIAFITWTLIGIFITGVNLKIVHKIALLFDNKIKSIKN
jgi:hypothetical protein